MPNKWVFSKILPIVGADFRNVVGVPHHSGVVYQDVETAKIGDRDLDDSFRPFFRGHAVVAGNGLPAGLPDLLHHRIGGCLRRTQAIVRRADIVNHDFGALGGQGFSLGPSNPIPGAGDHSYPAFQKRAHSNTLQFRFY